LIICAGTERHIIKLTMKPEINVVENTKDKLPYVVDPLSQEIIFREHDNWKAFYMLAKKDNKTVEIYM